MFRKSFPAKVGHALIAIGAWPGRWAAWVVLPIILAVLAAVLGGLFRLSELVDWGVRVPLLGERLTITSLAELQWHLLAILVMLGGAYALKEDRHVRVDLLYEGLGPRGRAVINILGDLLCLLPFCAIVAWLSLSFIDLSYRSGEESDYGGLVDRYLIKTVIPIGLALLFLTGVGRILVNLSILFGWEEPPPDETADAGKIGIYHG